MTILEAIAAEPRRAQQLANDLDLRWTTAYRTLTHLEEAGYLRRDPKTQEYLVGPRMYALGVSYLASHPLVHHAHGQLESVAADMGCAAQVNEREGMEVITLALADGPAHISKTSPAFKFPLGVAAKGQLLLAFAPEEIQQQVLSGPLRRFTAHTLTDPEKLAERLEEIRQADQAQTRDDLQVGIGSVAAPIRDAADNVIGCVSLIVRSLRLSDPADTDRLLGAAGTTARALSIGMGWRLQQTASSQDQVPEAVQPEA
jgi:IclR family transcriptional regulator, acetate operon repressor